MTTKSEAPSSLRPYRERYNAAGEELAKCEADLNSLLAARAQALVSGDSVADMDKQRKALQARIEDLRMLRGGLEPLLPPEERDALQVELEAANERSRRFKKELLDPARARMLAAEKAYNAAADEFTRLNAQLGMHGVFEADWAIRKHREAHPHLYVEATS